MRIFLFFCLLGAASFSKHYVFFSDCDPVIDNLIQRIDCEKVGIDMAMYSFTHQEVEAALMRAHKRGVRVRAIIDSFSEKMAYRLFEGGLDQIALIRSTAQGYQPIFHHKFILFHCNERDRAWVWTGSFNLSYAAEKRNFENVILTDSQYVFQKYTNYFNKTFEFIESKTSD